MPVSKAQQKAVNKYVRENYDKLLLTMPKGRKVEIQAHAQAQGESVNGFIGRAITETIEASKNPFILDEKVTHVIDGEEYDIYYRKRLIKRVISESTESNKNTPAADKEESED